MSDPKSDPLQHLLRLGVASSSPFAETSRYRLVEVAELALSERERIPYLRRRFVPQPEDFGLLREHPVAEGDRLDRIAAAHLGDPEQFWRLCDANRALLPDELLAEIGRRLRIPLPAGVPEPSEE